MKKEYNSISQKENKMKKEYNSISLTCLFVFILYSFFILFSF